MPFMNGIGRIREWDLFVVAPEHILYSDLYRIDVDGEVIGEMRSWS
jgi:hypothetical protein